MITINQEKLLPILASRIINLVQDKLDNTAKQYGYDDIRSAVTYAEEPSVIKFQQEGQAFRAWRSLVWAKCYEVMAEVQSGTRSIPTEQEILAELPLLGI